MGKIKTPKNIKQAKDKLEKLHLEAEAICDKISAKYKGKKCLWRTAPKGYQNRVWVVDYFYSFFGGLTAMLRLEHEYPFYTDSGWESIIDFEGESSETIATRFSNLDFNVK